MALTHPGAPEEVPHPAEGGGWHCTIPRFRGVVHAVAAAVAVPVGVLVVSAAGSVSARVAAAVFVVSLVAVFVVSATYHRCTHSRRVRERWRRADHSMIFVLIAGTYTPVCLLGLPSGWGRPLLVVVWAVAAIGVLCKLWAFDTVGRHASLLYVVCGWALVVVFPSLVTHTGALVASLLAAGGVCYAAGAVVLARNTPDPSPSVFGYHEVFHSATVLAAGCHVAAVALMV